jgi:hypothetical protein
MTRQRPAETSLIELLDDPMVGLLMQSDGVDRQSLERLLEAVERDRSQGAPSASAPLECSCF